MKAYLDTSALVKLYYPEALSAELSQWIVAANQPLPLTPIHELELKNALALKAFHKEIRVAQLKTMMSVIDDDLNHGVLIRQAMHWGEIFATALQHSLRYTPRVGTRSLDILHVSIALSCGCSHFLTFDDRQRRLAKKTGLQEVTL